MSTAANAGQLIFLILFRFYRFPAVLRETRKIKRTKKDPCLGLVGSAQLVSGRFQMSADRLAGF